jgi:hypothetical protein
MSHHKYFSILIVLFLLFISFPIVLADFNLDVSPNPVPTSSVVTFSGTCNEATQVALQLTRGPNTVWINQLDVIANLFSATFSPADGDYTLYATCNSSFNQAFCVGSSCTSSVIPPDSSGSPSSSSTGGSSSRSCRGNWSCTPWTYCPTNLEQTRSCVDLNNCRQEASRPNETQSCSECDQSWICSEWSSCSSGQNTRTCVDEHYCSATSLKPALSKSCTQQTVPGPQPVSVVPSSQLPPPSQSGYQEPQYASQGTVQQSTFSSFIQNMWQKYPIPIVGIPVAIILILFIVLFTLHHIHTHKPAVNQDQLHTYVKQESQAGLSTETIRKNLQSAGWNDTEISKALPSNSPISPGAVPSI